MRVTRGWACLALATALACGSSTTDAALAVDGETVSTQEVDEIAAFYMQWLPALGEDTARAAALESALLPRALARKEFPQGVAEARRKGELATRLLRERHSFEEVASQLSDTPRPKVPKAVYRGEIEPLLGVAVFNKPAGYVTPPIETSYAVIIARVDLPLNQGTPQNEGVVLSVIELLYDPSLADSKYRALKSHDDLAKAKIVELRPGAFRWLPAWLRAGLPMTAESAR